MIVVVPVKDVVHVIRRTAPNNDSNPEKITDIVVEFGKTHSQEIANRFLLTDQPVAKADL